MKQLAKLEGRDTASHTMYEETVSSGASMDGDEDQSTVDEKCDRTLSDLIRRFVSMSRMGASLIPPARRQESPLQIDRLPTGKSSELPLTSL